MKYFKYWVEDKHRITIDGQRKEISLLTGSNDSIGAAKKEALLKAQKIEQRIFERGRKDEYEAGIKEHVSDIIDQSNIVTVCRYGAKVLNTNEYTVLDLDDYATSIWDIFKPLRGLNKKERITLKFEQFVRRNPDFGSDFRIYETTKGLRIIGKKYLDPSNKKNVQMMRKLNVDRLYLVLSRKQQCYRARLTPKPYRLKIKTIKIRTPLACETASYKSWSSMYDNASRNVTVAKHIKSIGRDFSNERVIRYHDEKCQSDKGFELA